MTTQKRWQVPCNLILEMSLPDPMNDFADATCAWEASWQVARFGE
jgi:hypothetical protein